MSTPETIYLIPDTDGHVWCDDPAPGADMDEDDAIAYVRKDIAEARIRELESALEETFEQVYDNPHIDALIDRVLK